MRQIDSAASIPFPLIHNVMIVLQPTGERDNRFMIPLRQFGDQPIGVLPQNTLAVQPPFSGNHQIAEILTACSLQRFHNNLTPARNSALSVLKARPFHLPHPRRGALITSRPAASDKYVGPSFPARRVRGAHYFRCRPCGPKWADAPPGTT